MADLDLDKIWRQLKQWSVGLKSDPLLQTELRHLGFGLLACLVAVYSGFTLFLEPQQQKIAEQLALRDTLRSAAVGGDQIQEALAVRSHQLRQELRQLEQEKAILDLQQHYYTEQWRDWGDIDRFTGIILTMEEAAPVSLEGAFKQLSHMESRMRNDFAVHPVRLTGSAFFQELFAYLRYLESRPEISLLEDLVITREPVVGFDRKARVEFALTVGRIIPPERATP